MATTSSDAASVSNSPEVPVTEAVIVIVAVIEEVEIEVKEVVAEDNVTSELPTLAIESL